MHDLRPNPDSSAATFLFADIAGCTALTEAHGAEEAAKLVADFCDAVEAELPSFGDTQIKTIGDALMLRIPDPGQAVLLGLRVAHDILSGHGARRYESGCTTDPRSSATATTSAPRSTSPPGFRCGNRRRSAPDRAHDLARPKR